MARDVLKNSRLNIAGWTDLKVDVRADQPFDQTAIYMDVQFHLWHGVVIDHTKASVSI